MMQVLLATAALSVVPWPRSVRVGVGAYAWPARARVAYDRPELRNVAEQLRAFLRERGVWATVELRGSTQHGGTLAPAAGDVALMYTSSGDARLGEEGYALLVGPHGVRIRANAPRGAFYALQSLEQITAPSAHGLRSYAVAIEDRPEYRWRGVQLDVARHFFPVAVIERFIDLAAHYKLNVFHWHLTDDEGWRFTSARYPALGANGERYSAAEVHAVVEYAARRYVTVVPEIDLPAHAGAALRAYPALACGRNTLCTNGGGPAFARNVLGDALAQFPSPYIHAGGDEVTGAAAVVQPAFTLALERYLEARGRRLVGWDEILTPRLPARTVVMVWTSRKRVVQAVRQGNDVVVASAPLYFDAVQGDAAQEPRGSAHMSTLEQVYADGIVPPGLTPREAARVLGAQANLWSEHVATPQHLFYMALPRELALAEDVWTSRARKSWTAFVGRLPAQLAWLRAHGYAFRIPNASFALAGAAVRFEAVAGAVQTVRAYTTAPAVTVALNVPLDGAVIRYTTDGSAPAASSRAYRMPFVAHARAMPLRLRAAAFSPGRAGAVTECDIVRVSVAGMRAHAQGSTSWSGLVSP